MVLKSVLAGCLLACLPAGALGQSVAGRWCADSNRADCLVVTVSSASPEVITAVFQEAGRTYAEASGYFRDGRMTLAFRRTNTRDIGFSTFRLTNPTTAEARTFNPDGTQRWQGVYRRQ